MSVGWIPKLHIGLSLLYKVPQFSLYKAQFPIIGLTLYNYGFMPVKKQKRLQDLFACKDPKGVIQWLNERLMLMVDVERPTLVFLIKLSLKQCHFHNKVNNASWHPLVVKRSQWKGRVSFKSNSMKWAVLQCAVSNDDFLERMSTLRSVLLLNFPSQWSHYWIFCSQTRGMGSAKPQYCPLQCEKPIWLYGWVSCGSRLCRRSLEAFWKHMHVDDVC